jgi:predicted nucleic acid-binding protein
VVATGAPGLLLRAKKRGPIAPMGEVMDRWVSEAGFLISTKVRAQFLAEAAVVG